MERLTLNRFVVVIRQDICRAVRETAWQLDGNAYAFRFGWSMDEDDPYPGEDAWISDDLTYPADAPQWLASGDLEPAG